MNDFLHRNRIYTDDEIKTLTDELEAIDVSLPADSSLDDTTESKDKDHSHVDRPILHGKDLLPLDWETGNIAMSSTHFYMTYNDKVTGFTVKLTNRLNNDTETESGFDSLRAAKDWIKNKHYGD
ncbi:hypothetical protein [Psychrobacter sp. W2-37-MNA-CIBAN-0211]|uniref:hypothetical protein n=1 Tax=Psychrobacter sp. W2-37-MNA-CIBAN-0211 TaxID=3140443 RepID=UPI00333389E4